MVVIDTNVLSELMRTTPNAVVDTWAAGRDDLHITAPTVAEVRYGIERLPDGRRKRGLQQTAEAVLGAFQHQVLPFDTDAAREYATLVVDRERIGRPIHAFDAQIASICRARGATLATRDVGGFEHTGVELVDPWLAS